jgi:glycerate kinase
MMKILIAPGAFKHSLGAVAAANAIAAGLRRSGLAADLHIFPIADGGNGTVDVFMVGGGQRVSVATVDPLGRPIYAHYARLDGGKTAVIEMALASGLELLKPAEINPLVTTTYGTGLLMQAALNAGARRIIIGMGGSATVDGGAGCMQALDVHFLDRFGREVERGGGSVGMVHTVDTSQLDPRWREVEVIIASDVDNPALGNQGAAAVFGPQKGADSHAVRVLETNLCQYFARIHEQTGVDVREVRGGGAAGAFAAGLMAFLGGKIESGIDLILDYYHFTEHLKDADLVITGEGQMDEQTIRGKGPIGVARVAREYGIPTIAIVGGLNADDSLLHDAGIQAVLPIIPHPMPLREALRHAAELVEQAALRLGYLLLLKSG